MVRPSDRPRSTDRLRGRYLPVATSGPRNRGRGVLRRIRIRHECAEPDRRSCVHPDHRNGAVIGLLWSAVIRYLVAGGYNWLSGCASVPLADSGIQAASVWYQVSGKYLSPESYAVAPHRPWQPDPNSPAIPAAMPPLLRGYLRLGAWVCGPPAHDPVFDCADFFMLLDLRRLSPRHRQHFLGRSR